MKAIKITKERIGQILPVNIKESDVITENAKKTLATIMNYYYTLEVVRENKCLVISTDTLRAAVGIRKKNMLEALQELIEHNLIIREIGKKWESGEKHVASKYYVCWENLTKELKKNTAEDLISGFLQVLDNQGGNYSISNSSSNSISNSKSISNSASISASYSNSRSISDSSTNVMVNKKESSNNKKAMLHSNTTIELKERNGTNTLKEECNGSSMIEVKENKGMQSKHARTFSIEELRKYCTIKENELSKRYYTEQDVDRLEEELETYINRFQDVEGADKLLNDVFKETGELRGKLYFGGGLISENFEKEYNVTKVF